MLESLRPLAQASELDEPVHLAAHDPEWVRVFEEERRRLALMLSVEGERIQHIGSTAVPGMSAKPIVDLMLGVRAWPPAESLLRLLSDAAYQGLGEAGVPGRLYFRSREGVAKNIHVVVLGGSHWVSNRALRDYLEAHPEIARRYVLALSTSAYVGAFLQAIPAAVALILVARTRCT